MLTGNGALRLRLRAEDYARTHGFSAVTTGAALASQWWKSAQARSGAIAAFLVACRSRGLDTLLLPAALKSASAADLRALVEKPLVRSIVLKARVSNSERGVLLVSFENELLKVVANRRFADLEQRYQILFLPSWQPFYSFPFFRLAEIARRPFGLMPSSRIDDALGAQFGERCRVVPLQASSWVRAEAFGAQPFTRDIDLLMLANFAKYKRHWRLFEAVGELPGDTTVVVAGRPMDGRGLPDLRSEARCFGVEDRIEFRENPSQGEVTSLLNRAKVFCALSYKEGSYIAVAEALFSGAAVAMFAGALIGSGDYVNAETGFWLAPDASLAQQLKSALAAAPSLQPAAWAREHIAAAINVDRLNLFLQEFARRDGEPWTRDIARFYCENFDYHYEIASTEESMRDSYRELHESFGIAVRRPTGRAHGGR
jgi:glycosyltransferase involved in cell wall biosynthesis